MRIDRRAFVSTLAFGLLAGARPAAARCARVEPAAEARRSRYVFEGTVESVADDGTYTFVVTAVWKGAPPARVRVSRSGRGFVPSPRDVGTSWLVFAAGESDSSLGMSRCGSSGPLPATATTDALVAAGFARGSR